MLPRIDSTVHHTPAGVPYLKQPGVVMLGHTHSDLSGVDNFLRGFDEGWRHGRKGFLSEEAAAEELGFAGYLDDPDVLTPGTRLVKFAGQNCYLSLGPKRTRNKDAAGYIKNILEQAHGSVCEHVNFTFLLYGVSRSLTHELVRHRIAAYSQVSQRYVDGKTLRFVERPEFQDNGELHISFCRRIEEAFHEYHALAKHMADSLVGPADEGWDEDRRKEWRRQRVAKRKQVNQAARACLPNETEAPIVFTANVRSLRHMLEMRVAAPAEVEIRRAFHRVFKLAREVEPLLFADYVEEALPDGTVALSTPYRKV